MLLLREHTLEDERIKLSKIVQSYNKEKEELENLILKLETLKNDSEKYFQQVGFCTSLINNYGNYLSKIDSEVITQQNIIKNIEIELNKQQENTKKAYIELKTIENLIKDNNVVITCGGGGSYYSSISSSGVFLI